MAGVSLKCGDCGTLLRSVDEAQEHAELTKHANFVESQEPVLKLVCTSCGKSFRSQTVSEPIHITRTSTREKCSSSRIADTLVDEVDIMEEEEDINVGVSDEGEEDLIDIEDEL